MPRCNHKTLVGKDCQNSCIEGTMCYLHNKTHHECPICMNPLMRKGRVLKCNHEFHYACLNKWRETGNRTCPVCRAIFDKPRYKLKITIDTEDIANIPGSSQTDSFFEGLGVNPEDIPHIDNLSFDIMNEDDLSSILSDIGIPFPHSGL